MPEDGQASNNADRATEKAHIYLQITPVLAIRFESNPMPDALAIYLSEGNILPIICMYIYI